MLIYHADVFSQKPYAGNGLTVIIYEKELAGETMQSIAREFKQFETIFLKRITPQVYAANIYTVEEELGFAGHPVLGAAAVVHKEFFPDDREKTITFQLKEREVVTYSRAAEGCYEVTMNQGQPVWIARIDEDWKGEYCKSLNLEPADLCEEYPMEVVSTGLPYLLVPIRSGLERVKICGSDFSEKLAENGAKFVYVFDMNRMEGRTWDNLGMTEDVATGSAAGPMGAYLYRHGCCKLNETVRINQGQYVGRPSVLKVSGREETKEVLVSGEVVVLMKGMLQ